MFYFCETSTSPSIVDKSLELTLVAFAKISKSVLLIVKISVDFAIGKTYNFPLFKIFPSWTYPSIYSSSSSSLKYLFKSTIPCIWSIV